MQDNPFLPEEDTLATYKRSDSYREYFPMKSMEMTNKCHSVPKCKTTSAEEGKVR